MRIDRLILKNFRGFQDFNLPLDPQLTVIAGINGAGKTAVLDALAILLSWVAARFRHASSSGRTVRELDILNGAGYAVIRSEANESGTDSQQEGHQLGSVCWQLVKSRQGYGRAPVASQLEALSQFSKYIQTRIYATQENCNIPLFAYYPVHRAVLDIPLRIRQQHKFTLLEALDRSLTSAADFRSFFEWFRNREDLENENRRLLEQAPESDDIQFLDVQLEAVRKALESFMPEFSRFSVRRNPLRMTAIKRGKEVQVDQLSDGEKCLIGLTGDLARRLAIANPICSNPLEGEGVVLIDEIDLHLHPGWQRMIPKRLTETFPQCQFIVSTHSPQILGEVEPKQIRLLIQDDQHQAHYVIPRQSRGLTSNDILNELMRPPRGSEILTRDAEVEKRLKGLFRLIDQECFDEARAEISKLEEELHGDIPDLIRAQSLVTMLEGELEEG